MNKYIVEIELDTVELRVSAKNVTEAKQKAIKKLSKKNPKSFIKQQWPSKRKAIWVDEI